MKKLILIPVMMILLVGIVNAFSTDLNDYIFADTGTEQINGSVITTPANNSNLDTNRWVNTEAPPFIYAQGKVGYGNVSISSKEATNQDIFRFGEALSNVTLQLTYFDNSSDTTGVGGALTTAVGDSGLTDFRVETPTSGGFYVIDSASIPPTATGIARTDEPFNVTWFFAPSDSPSISLFANGTLLINETTGTLTLGGLRLLHDGATNQIAFSVDDIYLWSGTPEDRPQPPAPPPPDTQNPNFQAESINNTTPRINEVILISQNVSDETQLDVVVLAHNQSGILTNQTPIDISGTSFNATDTITVTASKGTVVGYQWAVNDTSGNSNTSVVRTFVVQNTAPETPTILAPTVDFFTNFLPVDINVTFNQDADGDTLTIHYFINQTLNQTSLTNTTFNASDNLYFLEVSITDGEVFTANVSVTFEIDTTTPIIVLTDPANQSSHSADIPVDISCTDLNVFILNYTFFNGSNIIRTAQDNISVANTLAIIDTIPIENLSDGNYNLNISCSDAHTSKQIGNYNPIKDLANLKLVYNTPRDANNIGIKLKATTATLDDYGTDKNIDRYVFWFDFVEAQSDIFYSYTFKIDSKTSLKYLPNSDFNGHFVTKYNWIDFEFDDNSDAIYTVKRTDVNKYEVKITTKKTFLNFRSIGGLNIAEQQLNITIDTAVAPAITGLVILPLENATSLVGMVALFIILFGLIVTLFRREKK